MNQDNYERHHWHQYSYNEGLITALGVGGFLIILGVVFGLIPGVWQSATAFSKDLTTIYYHYGKTTAYLLAPANPSAHADFYSAVLYFCLGIGVLQITLLGLRLALHSPFRRVTGTIGGLIFWFGAAVCVDVFLLAGTLTGWFQFWAALLLVIGVSLIVRGVIYLVKWQTKKPAREM
jgi:hypothetical protein